MSYDTVTISDLPVLTEITDIDTVPVVHDGVTYQIPVSDLPGSVDGPVSATDNAIVRFDGTTGAILQDSDVTIEDNGAMFIPHSLTIESTAPYFRLVESDAATDAKTWKFRVDGRRFSGQTETDSLGAGATWLQVDRTETTVDAIRLLATDITLGSYTGVLQATSGVISTVDLDELFSRAFVVVGEEKADYIVDGTNDDDEINQAMDDLHTAGGGTLYIKRASFTYDFWNSAQVYDNIRVYMDEDTNIKLANNKNVPIFKNNSSTGNVNIEICGGILDGNASNQTAFTGGLISFSAILGGVNKKAHANVTIKGVEVKNSFYKGIYFQQMNDCKVEECIVHDCGANGIDWFVCDNFKTHNNEVYNIDLYVGILANRNCSFGSIKGNYVHDVSDDGIQIKGYTGGGEYSEYNTIEENTIKNVGMGPGRADSVAQGQGILLNNAGNRRNTVRNNRIYRSRINGIEVTDNATEMILEGNIIFESGYNGAVTDALSEGAGISCSTNGDNHIITSNKIYSSWRQGILTGANNTITNNQVYDSGNNAVDSQYGIRFGANCIVTGNTSLDTRVGLGRTQLYGLYTSASLTTTKFTANIASNNVTNDTYLAGLTRDTFLTDGIVNASGGLKAGAAPTTGMPSGVSNYINNFDNNVGLRFKRNGTGTGLFIDFLRQDGTVIGTIDHDANTYFAGVGYFLGGARLTNTSSIGQVWTATDVLGNGTWTDPAGGGDVEGPASSTDNAVARFDSTTGKLIQDSVVTISDTGAIYSPESLTIESSSPFFRLIESDATTDAKTWKFRVDGRRLSGQTETDALGAGATWLQVDRTGTTIDAVRLLGTSITLSSFSGVLKGSSGVISGSATLNDLSAPTSSFSMNSQKITNLADPSSSGDGVNLGYLESYIASYLQGLDVKNSVRAATTANITLSGAQTIDGVSVIAGDRVLVKDQSTASQNGIYTAASGSWSRSTDADSSSEVTAGIYVWVTEGTANQDSGWILTTNDPITLGSTSLTFSQFSGAGQITAGAGLTKSGNTIDIVGTSNRITVNTDSIDIASTYVGQASITTLGTISTGVWNGDPIDIDYGGTGRTSYTVGSVLFADATVIDEDPSNLFWDNSAKNLGIGLNAPTARIHVAAGTSSAGTAPIKLTSGTNLSSPEAGALEFNGTNLFFTPSASRKTIAFTDSNITGTADNVSGTVAVNHGGTGATTLTGVVIGNGTSAFTTVAAPSGTLVGTTDTQTLSNKTLTAPVISSIVNTGTLTLPTASDTLVGRATTDTLTNKTISGSNNTITNVSLTAGVTGTLPTGNGGTGLSSIGSAYQLLHVNSAGSALEYATPDYRILYKSFTDISISNDNTEQTIMTFTVPANTLGSSNLIRVDLDFDVLNNSGSGITFTLRGKYGGTAFAQPASGTFASSATRRPGRVALVLKGSSAPGVAGTVDGSLTAMFSTIVNFGQLGTITKDSTSDQTLLITVQLSAADTNVSFKMKAVTATLTLA